MKEFEYSYSIRSEFSPQPESPAALGAKFLKTLDALSCVDSIFAHWMVNDVRALTMSPIAEARSRIAEIVQKNVKRDDVGPDPNAGYNMSATTGTHDPRSMNISIEAGGKWQGGIVLEAGYVNVPSDPAIVTYPVFKAALRAIGAGWPATWGCASVFKLHYDKVPLIPGTPLFPYSRFHITWLGYLSKPLIGGLVLPPDILTERTPDGGLLMIAAEERLEPKNPEHLRRARILAETMIARTGVSSE
jgi:hypothetical protein